MSDVHGDESESDGGAYCDCLLIIFRVIFDDFQRETKRHHGVNADNAYEYDRPVRIHGC